MSGKRLATAAAFCALAIPGALAQKAAPAAAEQARSRPAAWLAVLPSKATPKQPPVASQAASWSAQEIEIAQARCTALLKDLAVVVVREVPIREGAECGTPAPVRLVSVGKGPEIAFSPPPVVTCDMVATLYRWLQRDVQPLARKHLGAPVIRIETMSSYSCRNAYGRAGSRLSEHGKANAVDIGSFVTARGLAAMVVADWGPTARQIAAEADAKAEADGARPKAQTAAPAGPAGAPAAKEANAPVAARPSVSISIPGVTVLVPGLPRDPPTEMGLTPSRLGGPKPAVAATAASPPDGKMDFLRGAHRTACKLFNTVLGPEANNAHHNHFHLDMAERVKSTKLCE
jgi:hypothetical protein